MKKILITGALGQIGTELVLKLRDIYGSAEVIATNRSLHQGNAAIESGPFALLDVTDAKNLEAVYQKYKPDTIFHLASLLSAVAETKPQQAWQVNMGGLINVLELAREKGLKVFIPSSIGAFGASTPKDNTPQDTLQRPSTMYGVTKVAGELLADYYFQRYGVDTRGLRYPGLISHVAPPGGGTTDYAVEIYYAALQKKSYTSFIAQGTKLDMMYMPDALQAAIALMEADPAKLVHRNAFNVSAMSCAPEDLALEIRRHIPEFTLDYAVDPLRQAIAYSWPNALDTSCAAEEWGFKAQYDLQKMTEDMLAKLKLKLKLKDR